MEEELIIEPLETEFVPLTEFYTEEYIVPETLPETEMIVETEILPETEILLEPETVTVTEPVDDLQTVPPGLVEPEQVIDVQPETELTEQVNPVVVPSEDNSNVEQLSEIVTNLEELVEQGAESETESETELETEEDTEMLALIRSIDESLQANNEQILKLNKYQVQMMQQQSVVAKNQQILSNTIMVSLSMCFGALCVVVISKYLHP